MSFPANEPPKQPGYNGPPPGYGVPPPSYGVPPPVSVQPATVVVQAPPIIRYNEAPIQVRCTKCNNDILTSTEYVNGMVTWLACGLCVIFGCGLGCCLIPFCVNSCKDVIHTCPNCNQLLGRYSRM